MWCGQYINVGAPTNGNTNGRSASYVIGVARIGTGRVVCVGAGAGHEVRHERQQEGADEFTDATSFPASGVGRLMCPERPSRLILGAENQDDGLESRRRLLRQGHYPGPSLVPWRG